MEHPSRPLLRASFHAGGLDHREGPVPIVAGLVLFAIGQVLQIAEYFWIRSEQWSINKDQLIGTAPLGLGAFLLAQRLPNAAIVRTFASLGRYSMGLFALHLIVLELIAGTLPIRSFGHELVDVAVAAAATTLLCVLLGRLQRLRPLLR